MTEIVAVLGAGSWGTALAIQLARNDLQVRLWGHHPEHIERLRALRENTDYLPGYSLADNIEPQASLPAAVEDAGYLLIAIPSKGFRDLLAQLKPLIDEAPIVFWASKGFEIETGKLLHEVIEDELPRQRYGVVSGPTFAAEVAQNLPAAITCAGNQPLATEAFAELLRAEHFRAYTTDDVIGVELGGALKNVLAIAVGIADGLGYGANTRAALITRGLAEIMRLGTSLGARQETLMGLAGLGDIIRACARQGQECAAGGNRSRADRRRSACGESDPRQGEGDAAGAADHRAGIPGALRGQAAGRGGTRSGEPAAGTRIAPLVGEAQLAPGLVNGDRDAVRQVEAARAPHHRDPQPAVRRQGLQYRIGQAAAFRPEQQSVAGFELGVGIGFAGARGKCE